MQLNWQQVRGLIQAMAMARLSSASSTESEYVPAMVPFRWEVAPGIPAVRETSTDPPSLPLPPGKRPKDGFYLTYARPAQSAHSQNEASGMNSSSKIRSSKKPFFTSRKPRRDAHEDVNIFRPESGHRFGSRVTRRVLVELHKRRSCLGGCWSHGVTKPSPQNHHQSARRRLDSIDEEIREPDPTPSHSPASSHGHSRPLSPVSSHGHGRSRTGAGNQSQVLGGSRFMASMLMSLCPAEGEEEEEEAVDTENEITSDDDDDDDDDSFSIDLRTAMPRAQASSPEVHFQAPQREIATESGPATSATSPEERTRAWVDMSRCNLSERSHNGHLPVANTHYCGHCGGTKVLQPATSLATNYKSDRRSCDRISTSSTVWLEALRSSPQWPHPAPKTSRDDGSSDADSDICSTVSSEHGAVSQLATPMLLRPPKSATWEVSQTLLKSSSLLKYKQQRQERHQSPRSSFAADEYLESSTALPCPRYDSTGAGSLSEVMSSKLNCGVMSKVAKWESKAGVGSASGKSSVLPVCLSRRNGIIVTGHAVSR